jgi:hypothetical protein
MKIHPLGLLYMLGAFVLAILANIADVYLQWVVGASLLIVGASGAGIASIGRIQGWQLPMGLVLILSILASLPPVLFVVLKPILPWISHLFGVITVFVFLLLLFPRQFAVFFGFAQTNGGATGGPEKSEK